MKKIVSLLIPILFLSSCEVALNTNGSNEESSSVESSSKVESSSSSVVESSSSSVVESSSSTIEESSSTSTIDEVTPYTVTFSHDEHVSIYVYASQDYTVEPTLTDTGLSVDGDTGAYLDNGEGQVNFKLIIEEGYTIDGGISITGEYKNLKTPTDTEEENVYRITKIASDLTVTINTTQTTAPAYTVTFDLDEHVSVYVYATKDYTVEPTLATIAYSVDDNGTQVHDGEGQINIKLVFDEGYTLDSISHNEKNYKNLKGPDETEVENVYRVTKITGDFTLTITSKLIEEE